MTSSNITTMTFETQCSAGDPFSLPSWYIGHHQIANVVKYVINGPAASGGLQSPIDHQKRFLLSFFVTQHYSVAFHVLTFCSFLLLAADVEIPREENVVFISPAYVQNSAVLPDFACLTFDQPLPTHQRPAQT